MQYEPFGVDGDWFTEETIGISISAIQGQLWLTPLLATESVGGGGLSLRPLFLHLQGILK